MNNWGRIEATVLVLAGLGVGLVAGAGKAGDQQSAPGDEQNTLAASIVAPQVEMPADYPAPAVIVGSGEGLVPVVAVERQESQITVDVRPSAENRAYGFVVRPGESLKVHLQHPLQSYFSLLMVDRFGKPLPLTLVRQQMSGLPVVFYENTTDKDVAAYVVVEYVDWVYKQGETCKLDITRDRR